MLRGLPCEEKERVFKFIDAALKAFEGDVAHSVLYETPEHWEHIQIIHRATIDMSSYLHGLHGPTCSVDVETNEDFVTYAKCVNICAQTYGRCSSTLRSNIRSLAGFAEYMVHLLSCRNCAPVGLAYIGAFVGVDPADTAHWIVQRGFLSLMKAAVTNEDKRAYFGEELISKFRETFIAIRPSLDQHLCS